MTCKIRYVDFYHDEWLAGTATLDPLDIGIYVSACALIYSHGGRVLRSEVKRFVRCHGTVFENALKRLLGLGKLDEDGAYLTSKRCVNELEKARKRVVNASENGSKGGRPPRYINGLDKAVGSNARAEPLTYNQEESKNPPYPPEESLPCACAREAPAQAGKEEAEGGRDLQNVEVQRSPPLGRSLLRPEHGDPGEIPETWIEEARGMLAAENREPCDLNALRAKARRHWQTDPPNHPKAAFMGRVRNACPVRVPPDSPGPRGPIPPVTITREYYEMMKRHDCHHAFKHDFEGAAA